MKANSFEAFFLKLKKIERFLVFTLKCELQTKQCGSKKMGLALHLGKKDIIDIARLYCLLCYTDSEGRLSHC